MEEVSLISVAITPPQDEIYQEYSSWIGDYETGQNQVVW
jgi:hypothetical protein